MKRTGKIDSIAFKLAIAFIITVIVQSIIVSALIVSGGVIRHSRMNEYKIFSEKVNGRKDNLENQMTNVWTDFDLYTKNISSYFEEVRARGDMGAEHVDRILEELAPVVMDCLYHTKTTGAFLILNNEDEESSSHPALYFRNANPDRNDGQRSNLYLVAGPWSVAEKMDVVTAPEWNFYLQLNDENRDFYEKPFQVTGLSGESRWLGYWSPPFSVAPGSEPVITYSIPVTDECGNTWGVFGVEISVSYLSKALPAAELKAEHPYGYTIGFRSAPGEPVRAAFTNGVIQKRIIKENDPLNLQLVDEENSIYDLELPDGKDPVYACSSRMQMYYNNTPFSGEEWFLIGMMDRKTLLQQPNRIERSLFLSLVASLLIGLVIAVITSKWFTKFARLIELSGVSVGVFEMKKGKKKMVMTSQIPILFHLSKNQEREFCRNRNEFQAFIEETYQLVPDETNVFRRKDGAEDSWLRITWKISGDTIRGIVEDVTEEILHTKELKAERDYDGLTDVKNRRAFERMISFYNDQLKPHSQIAVVMCDLNDLKKVNDLYGHDKGDEYIRFAAWALCEAFSIGSVFRIGGDEFAVIVENISETEVRRYCRKLIKNVESFNKKKEFEAGLALGYAFYDPQTDDSMDQVMAKADADMYSNKKEMKKGGNL